MKSPHSKGVPTFGTVDLLAALEIAGQIKKPLATVIRAQLVAAYHVDLGFDADAFTLAAQLESWEPKGAAAALTRISTWGKPSDCVDFGLEALRHAALTSPTGISRWTGAVAIGMVRIVGGDTVAASKNLALLLRRLLVQPWFRPDTFLFVLEGLRLGVADLPGTEDPLRSVLVDLYSRMVDKLGPPDAAEGLLKLVQHLAEADRWIAANIILTAV